MIELQKSHLAAALECAAPKDVRFYLNGVLLEVCASGDVHLVTTDGAVLFAGLLPQAETTIPKGTALIIPRDVVARECKGTHPSSVQLTAAADGYRLGSTVFTPIDGHFPDWRLVASAAAKIVGQEGATGQFDPRLLARARQALALWHRGRASWMGFLHHNGTDNAVMTGDDDTAFCIVSPHRVQAAGRPFPLAPLYSTRSLNSA